MIDLQIHTTASDGRWDLEQIIGEAHRKRIAAIAITDHDTIDGWKASQLAALSSLFWQSNIGREHQGKEYTDRFFVDNLVVIQGEEVTCRYSPERRYEIHILAYFLDEAVVAGSTLAQHNERMIPANYGRAKWIIDRLRSKGYTISYDDVVHSVSNAHALTRDYIARWLLKHNEPRLREEAARFAPQEPFGPALVRNVILGTGTDFYAPIDAFYQPQCEFPDMAAAVRMILDCKGVPVLSHPGRYKFLKHEGREPESHRATRTLRVVSPEQAEKESSSISPEQLMRDLIRCSNGLAGIEVYNKRHKPKEAASWLARAQRHQVLYTAGSDFHGEEGDALGLPAVSGDILQNLYAAHKRVCDVRKL